MSASNSSRVPPGCDNLHSFNAFFICRNLIFFKFFSDL
jgi:hypothetical protein